MPASIGYNSFSDNSLVFHYDTGDTANSFKGKQAVNLVPNASTMDDWASYSSGNDGRFLTEFGTQGYRMRHRGSWNGLYRGISLPSTGTYTISAWFRWYASGDGNNGATVYTSGGGISDTAAGIGKVYGEWRRTSAVRTFTTTSFTFYLISYGGTGGGSHSTWEVTMPQVEAGSVATPFVNGTRTDSQALLDLTGNRTITTPAAAYSGNTLAFDGTSFSNHPNIGGDWVVKTGGGWTMEHVVYYNSVPGGYNNTTSPACFFGSDSTTYNNWYWSVLENKLALWNISPGYWRYGSTTLQPGRYYHVAITCNEAGSRYQFYLNGVAEGGDHQTTEWSTDYSGLRVNTIAAGNSANRRTLNGEQPVTKIFTRTLTPDEIYNSYLQYKTRFNL
jgi:hypothetical protein